MIANEDATTSAGTSGSLSWTLRTTFPVTVERTATGFLQVRIYFKV
jgi:hypothetical protein